MKKGNFYVRRYMRKPKQKEKKAENNKRYYYEVTIHKNKTEEQKRRKYEIQQKWMNNNRERYYEILKRWRYKNRDRLRDYQRIKGMPEHEKYKHLSVDERFEILLPLWKPKRVKKHKTVVKHINKKIKELDARRGTRIKEPDFIKLHSVYTQEEKARGYIPRRVWNNKHDVDNSFLNE